MSISVNNRPSFGTAASKVTITERLLRKLPHREVGDSAFARICAAAEKHVSSPEQRLILGVTALFTQPFIDLNNKRVDEDTRMMSFARTLAKIIVGTTVGVIVRKGCIKAVDKYLSVNKVADHLNPEKFIAYPKIKSFLCPDKIVEFTEEAHKKYINTVGTLMGIFVSLFTNFLIDAPLTQILTNTFYNKVKKGGSDEASKT